RPPPLSTLFPYTTLFRSQLRGDDVRLAYLLDVVDGDDSWVVEGQHGLRLLTEAADALLVAREARGQNLQRDFARSPLVERQVDLDRKSTRLNSSHDQISY